MKVGDFYTYNGNEYCVTSVGQYSVRLERGCGRSHSVIVLPWEHLCINMKTEDVIAQLEEWESIFFKNTEHFIREKSRFTHVWDFEGIYFSSEHVKIYYILQCGQHVADSMEIEEFLEFINYYAEG